MHRLPAILLATPLCFGLASACPAPSTTPAPPTSTTTTPTPSERVRSATDAMAEVDAGLTTTYRNLRAGKLDRVVAGCATDEVACGLAKLACGAAFTAVKVRTTRLDPPTGSYEATVTLKREAGGLVVVDVVGAGREITSTRCAP